MKLKNTKKWHTEPNFENLLFFAQRLDELFFDYTLDTFKPPALTSIYLCREAISLIEDIEESIIDNANLEYVLDELEWSLASDPIAKHMLNAPLRKFIQRGDGVKLSSTKVRLEVLERSLNPLIYSELCEDLLANHIDGGSKKEIEKLSRVYASTLINMGISKQHLYDKTQEFFFYGKEIKSFSELKDFFISISPTSHQYEIYFVVSGLIKEVEQSIEIFDLAVVDELPPEVSKLALKNSLTLSSNEVWVEVKGIEAFDRHTARKKAETKLDMVRDLFLLFSHKNRISWNCDSIITQCCEDIPVLIRRPKNAMEKCFDLRASDASNRLNSMIQTLALNGNSFLKFHRAVDLHAIGTTNDLPENQLLNIWIALETLVPSHVYGGGKIVKVSNGIMPILLRNYLSRFIKRLAADLIRWNREETSKALRKIRNSRSKKLYQKVLELVALEENIPILESLYEKLGEFVLLRYRLFEMTELFKKPENLMKKVDLHEKKVAWQLRRIYRTRNLIVHSGRSISYIDTLIENAHDYLDQTMNSVIKYSCGYLSATSLEQAFDMARIDNDVFLKEMRNIKEFDEDNLQIILL